VFDISFTELMLIGVVALVVIGPERLPKLARTVGHLLGRAQRYVNDVKGDIQREVELEELRKMKEEMESAANSMQSSFTHAESSLRESIHEPISDLQLDSEPKQNPSIELPQQRPEDDVKGATPDSAERKQ
jgi:sec-independent protein translocase protein TatB